MKGDEARKLLGFPPNCRPSASQVKAAYKRKVWESHPDRFPVHEKSCAESKFKLISEAYRCLQSVDITGPSRDPGPGSVVYSHVVRSGVPRAYGGSKNQDSTIGGSGNPSVVPNSHKPQQETTPDSISPCLVVGEI